MTMLWPFKMTSDGRLQALKIERGRKEENKKNQKKKKALVNQCICKCRNDTLYLGAKRQLKSDDDKLLRSHL